MQRRKRRDLSTSLLEYGSRVRLKPEFTRSGLGVIEGRGMCIFVDGEWMSNIGLAPGH
jgi:hypothetical protein